MGVSWSGLLIDEGGGNSSSNSTLSNSIIKVNVNLLSSLDIP
jgi:hypothetical protein